LASSGNWLISFTLDAQASVNQMKMENLFLGSIELERTEDKPRASSKQTEILWDSWGVPHIFAQDAKGLFYAFGWAQMHSHGHLLLGLYGQARGRASAYWGKEFLIADRMVHTMGLYDVARGWYQQQSPRFRGYLNAFAAGINDYAKAHPDRIADELEVVLPVTAIDVLAHAARVNYVFLGVTSGCTQVLPAGTQLGSNGWAIGPSHSASGQAMLLANPHLPWADGLYFFYEAQLTAPGIYDAYGATLVGLPVLTIAFNDHLGWTHTTNTIDACDVYALTPAEDGYLFDGQVRSFETSTRVLTVKGADGTLSEEHLTIRRSIHGPVVEKEGQLLAIRMAAIEGSSIGGGLEQYWDMARSKNLSEFQSVLRRMQLSSQTVIYADRDGHVMSLFNGHVPIRPKGDWNFWSGVVPGDTSETLWTKIHTFDDLPKVIDPPSGWVQNSNSPPWYTTFPPALHPDDYPPYMAPRSLGLREQRGIRMLDEDSSISFEEMMMYKFSTRMELADRVLDELITAARRQGSDLAKRAADVLEAWDRHANPDSRGAILFFLWVQEMSAQGPLFAQPWEEKNPRITPKDLSDPQAAVRALEAAAARVQSATGALDVPWGALMRMRRGTVDLPANGGPSNLGIFRYLALGPAADGRFEVVHGDSFIAAVEFSNPLKARVLLTYGNATQPGSPLIGDQLQLYVQNEMRPVWRTREEIEAHLESREIL
jgi:acyl-homoserine-lactone acylase